SSRTCRPKPKLGSRADGAGLPFPSSSSVSGPIIRRQLRPALDAEESVRAALRRDRDMNAGADAVGGYYRLPLAARQRAFSSKANPQGLVDGRRHIKAEITSIPHRIA